MTRISDYHHLRPSDRVPPGRPNVFFDPVDTEVGVWATVDLIRPGARVLDLGSGSGAPAAAVARAGAGHVHGFDISDDSVAWGIEHHATEDPRGRVSFSGADYSALSPAQLLDASPFSTAPDVITSNPPYVPLPSPDGVGRRSIDGGADGLHLVRRVVGHAEALGSDLAVTIGSYTSPRQAANLLYDHGYQLSALTLGVLRLGDHTVANIARVSALEATGEGPLLRIDDGAPYYIVVGLSCRRRDSTPDAAPPPEELLTLLQTACRSRTPLLETLDGFPTRVPLRMVNLPDEHQRLHV
ncbi:methyltransferase domain-containing protein [Streptomyces corynorhini]|uniref:methyltransferase domain-containing protein n=1 Tax=Streptomyces corynorhini TaxID=2282652 RepID=UPI0011C03AEA|nr:methyltransferase domain-containing protein [Streptomyces corynorhini]